MKHRFFTKRIVIVVAIFSLMVLALVIGFTPSQKAQGPEPSIQEQQRPPDPRLAAKYGQPDRITGVIRNQSTELVRVRIDSFGDRAAAVRIGTIVEDYGSFLVIAKNKQANLDAIGLETQALNTVINLPGRKFEPTKNAPPSSIIDGASSAPGKKDYYIVQFGSIAQGEWLESLRAMGGEVIQYVPQQAFFVYADGEAMAKIVGHSRVRWAGRYTAEDKLSPELSAFTARVEGATVTLDVAVFNSENLDEAAVEIAGISGGQVRHVIKLPSNFFNVVRIEMPKSNIRAVAEISGVFRIDQYEKPMPEDERAAQIVAGNYVNPTTINPPGYNSLTQFLVDGTNVTVGVADDGVNIPGNGGFYITAANTSNGPLRGAAAGATGGHGHLNASIIAGDSPFGVLDPTGYNYGLGVARKANILNIPFLVGGYGGVEADTVNDVVTTAGVNGVNGSISNNSWGNGTNANSYDAYAAMFDGFVQDASAAAPIDPILLVFSAGNSGASGLTRPKVAKNLIATASSENIRTEIQASANNMDDLSSFSSRGLAADGRVKPDITAPGEVVTGSRAGTGGSVSGQVDANHSFSIGTSHAAPQVAGAAALFTQFWKAGNGGVNPSPALVKAAILNTGQDMNGVGSTATIPNGGEGWGRMNMSFMLNTGVPIKYVNQGTAFSNPGESFTTSGTVANAAKPVRISLVWTDPPGAGNPALVNNLDLTVTVGGNTFKGNVFSAGSSTTGGAADTLNNVENVFIPAGLAVGSPMAVQVSAIALNGNGILGNADATDQHFALVVYNFTETGQAVMAGGAPVITAEGRTPANNAPDPGEAITANLPISNVGASNTTNLVATLQNSGGVTAIPTGENQNYGAVLMGGPAVTRPFTFRTDGPCGSTVTATLALQDGATNLGTVKYTFQLGTTVASTAFSENFDVAVVPPALPAGWTTAVTGSGVAFVTSTINPSSAPNDAFAPDVTTTGTSELVSPSIPITSAAAQLTFRNLFNTESTFDGLVLEISIGAGPFTDIVTAGGSFASGGYNGSITQSGTCIDPLNGRSAWTGLSGGTAAAPTYITTVANIPAAANGQNIRLKWLVGHDCSIAPATNPGVRVDTVSISSTVAVCVSPTAAPANVSGRITDPNGVPVGGATIGLSGGASRTAITDAAGNYHFDNLDTGELYSVTPALANYHFSPASRSFSLVGNMTDAAFTATADASQSANAIDSAEYFVRQQYLDFLGREPDQGGLEFWSGHLNACGTDAACIREKRIEVSAAFFMSGEFQETGSYVYDMYAGLLGRTPGYNEFTPDRAQVIGGSGLDKTKTAFAGAFVQRSEFTSRYPASLNRDQFVDAVLQTMQQRSGVDLSSQRGGLLTDYDNGGRALVARHAAELSLFVSAEYNRAFVLMEYFGYLRRGEDPNGYQFWLNVLNQGSGNDYRGMVCSFLTSTEYQHRFSSVVTHSNSECGQ